jgi:hypothetical protein
MSARKGGQKTKKRRPKKGGMKKEARKKGGPKKGPEKGAQKGGPKKGSLSDNLKIREKPGSHNFMIWFFLLGIDLKTKPGFKGNKSKAETMKRPGIKSQK